MAYYESNACRLLTDASAHIFTHDSARKAGFGKMIYMRSGLSSSVRSSASAEARSTTKKAALEAKAASLKKLHELQIEELHL